MTDCRKALEVPDWSNLALREITEVHSGMSQSCVSSDAPRHEGRHRCAGWLAILTTPAAEARNTEPAETFCSSI